MPRDDHGFEAVDPASIRFAADLKALVERGDTGMHTMVQVLAAALGCVIGQAARPGKHRELVTQMQRTVRHNADMAATMLGRAAGHG